MSKALHWLAFVVFVVAGGLGASAVYQQQRQTQLRFTAVQREITEIGKAVGAGGLHVRLIALEDGRCVARYFRPAGDLTVRSVSVARWPARKLPGGGLACFIDEQPPR